MDKLLIKKRILNVEVVENFVQILIELCIRFAQANQEPLVESLLFTLRSISEVS